MMAAAGGKPAAAIILPGNTVFAMGKLGLVMAKKALLSGALAPAG